MYLRKMQVIIRNKEEINLIFKNQKQNGYQMMSKFLHD